MPPISKKTNIVFWVTTIAIVIFEGVMPALTGNSKLAVDSFHMLGFPDYFRVQLTIFKVLGAIALAIPTLPRWVKEWTYAGFMIDFISAFIANVAVYGFGAVAILPLVCIVILIISYRAWRKMNGIVG